MNLKRTSSFLSFTSLQDNIKLCQIDALINNRHLHSKEPDYSSNKDYFSNL